MPLTPRRPLTVPPPLPEAPPISALPVAATSMTPPAAARSTRERLAAIERHPEFRALASHKPRQGFARKQAFGEALGGVILPIGAVALIVKSLNGRNTGDLVGPFLLAIPALGFGSWFAWRAVRFFFGEIERRPAIVKDTRLIERRHKGRTHYQFRVTLAMANDEREWRTDRRTWDAARTGAAVVAFTRGNFLLETAPVGV